MSHQASPGPPLSHPHSQPQPPPVVSSRKWKNLTSFTAGADDLKYQAKYKELKRKVKEIESVSPSYAIRDAKLPWFCPQDNDKLHFKVLQAKRSIQRMKLERAYALILTCSRAVSSSFSY